MDEQWQKIWEGLREFQEWFPDGMILIGGLAVWLHGSNQKDLQDLVETSHDADFLLSLTDYAYLRDIEEVTRNRRLNKHQVIKNGVDFDIYVENHNDLSIPYEEAARFACEISGFNVLCPEHLLVLKTDAAKARNGAKGKKDLRDLLRILLLLENPNPEAVDGWLTEERRKVVESALSRGDLLKEIAGGNQHRASKLRDRCLENWRKTVHAINTAAQSADSRSKNSSRPGLG